MTTKEILIAARAKIDTPERWIKDRYARDAHGRPVYEGSKKAVCYCAAGAIRATARLHDRDAAMAALDAVAPGRDAVDFNDHPTTTHADVLALFVRAIAAESEAA